MLTRRPRRSARGMTLLELAVVAVITAALFVVLLHWVFSLIGVSSQGTALGELQNSTVYADQTFAADVAAAVPCDAGATQSPLDQISESAVSFYVTNSSGGDDLVEWQVVTSGSSKQLQRAVIAGNSSMKCSGFSASPSWTVILPQVTNASANASYANGTYFVPWSEGAPQAIGSGTTITCTGTTSCAGYDAIEMAVEGESSGSGGPVNILDRLYSIDIAGSRSSAGS